MAIMSPVPNLNGTSREELVAMRLKAVNALYDAMNAMQDLSPHMRDYLGNNEAWRADRDIHAKRFSGLDTMANELMDEAYRIANPT